MLLIFNTRNLFCLIEAFLGSNVCDHITVLVLSDDNFEKTPWLASLTVHRFSVCMLFLQCVCYSCKLDYFLEEGTLKLCPSAL